MFHSDVFAFRPRKGPVPLFFAGLRYPVVDTGSIPEGFCEVNVKLDDGQGESDCKMVAGHVGHMVSAQQDKMDTLQSSSHWFMFVKGEAETEREAWAKMKARRKQNPLAPSLV